VKANADAPISGTAGGSIGVDQRLQRRNRRGEHGLPLRLDELAESSHRLLRKLLRENRLLDVRGRVGQDVGDAGAQMITDVAGEKCVGAFAVARRDDPVARELDTIAFLDGQAEPAKLVEKAARM